MYLTEARKTDRVFKTKKRKEFVCQTGQQTELHCMKTMT